MPWSLDQRVRVQIAFAEVMEIMQGWEATLEALWWRTQRKHPNRRTGDSDSPRSQREIVRFERAMQQKAISEIKGAVKPLLDPETAEKLDALIAARNRLAHRFLREQAVHDAGGNFQPGTLDALHVLGEQFMESYRSAMDTLMALPGYDGPVPSHWPALADRIIDRVLSGQSVPRDPGAQ